MFTLRQRSVVPGFKLTLGYTLLYLSLIVLIPLGVVVWKAAAMPWAEFWASVSSARALASYRVTLLASLSAAAVNVCFGLLIAWVLVRYNFWGKRFVDALVDLPFALPTAVAGIALTTLYAPKGWIGRFLCTVDSSGQVVSGLQIAYTPIGIWVALTFIGLPFVVRTVQPVLEDFDAEVEEAAASLGANRWQTFRHVILPTLFPPLLTGFALAFARALGEYGSVVFISGNKPMKTEITPLLIITKLEQYDYSGAIALAVVMLVASFFMLLTINLIQWWGSRHTQSA